VYGIDVCRFEGDELDLEVRCSPGTYVRALARDLGEALGVGGHLTALRRTRSGSFGMEHAVDGNDLERCADRLIGLSDLLTDLPAVTVGPSGRERVRHGRDLGRGDVVGELPSEAVERVRVLDEAGELLAVAVPRVGGGAPAPEVEPLLHPDVVLLI